MNEATTLLERDIAISLMKKALLHLDNIGDGGAAAALQAAIDIAEEVNTLKPA